MTTLPHEARQTLARLELASNGPCQAFDREGGRSSERPSRPAGASVHEMRGEDGEFAAVPHEFWRRKMEQEPWDMDKHIEGAQNALERLLKAPDPVELVPETKEERDQRIRKEGEGWDIASVAIALKVTHREVIDARSRAGLEHELDIATGRKLKPEETKEERVQRLGKTNMTVRDIAQASGVPTATVHRWLRKAA